MEDMNKFEIQLIIYRQQIIDIWRTNKLEYKSEVPMQNEVQSSEREQNRA